MIKKIKQVANYNAWGQKKKKEEPQYNVQLAMDNCDI